MIFSEKINFYAQRLMAMDGSAGNAPVTVNLAQAYSRLIHHVTEQKKNYLLEFVNFYHKFRSKIGSYVTNSKR